MKSSRGLLILLGLLGVATAGCDLATKRWATASLSVPRLNAGQPVVAGLRDPRGMRCSSARETSRPLVVLPDVLELVYTENCAGAFGVLHQLPVAQRRCVLLTGNLIVAIALVAYARRRGAGAWRTHAGVVLVIAGAFGNAFDRITMGFVVDFIHAHWHTLEWPVFNVADIAITTGIALLLTQPRVDSPASRPEANSA